MRFIGITGGVGSGKSEILGYIGKHYKCEIYLADEAAHLVKQPGTKAYETLLALLGRDIAGADGQIDKGVMADRIFADPDLLEQVNGIIHPAVKEFLLEKLDAARKAGQTDFFFVEAALLIEGGYLALVDEMWYIYADEQVRRRRLKEKRGYSDEKITAIFRSQLKEEEYRRHCKLVINNSESLESACREIEERIRAI